MIEQVALKYESRGNKSFVTWSLQDREQMDHIEMEMLRLNEIPGLLSFNLMQTDEEVTCCYDITSLTKLRGILMQTMNRQQLFKLLEQMASVMETAGDYMLDADHFVLNTEYIYMRPGEPELYFMLLPVRDVSQMEQITFLQFLKNLLSSLQYDSGMDQGAFYIKVMNYVNSVQVTNFREFRERLHQFMGMVKPTSPFRTGDPSVNSLSNMSNAASGVQIPVAPAGEIERRGTGASRGVSISGGGTAAGGGRAGTDDISSQTPSGFVQKRSMVSREMKQDVAQGNMTGKDDKTVGIFGGMSNREPGGKKARWERKKEKEKKKQQNAVPEIPGMQIPGMQIPGAQIPGTPGSDSLLHADDQSVFETPSAEHVQGNGQEMVIPGDIAPEPEETPKKKKHFLFGKKEADRKGAAVNGPVPNSVVPSKPISTPAEEMGNIPAQKHVGNALATGYQNSSQSGIGAAGGVSGITGGSAAGISANGMYGNAGTGNGSAAGVPYRPQEIAGTVLMEEMSGGGPFLEYAKTGERVYIDREYFQIGRDPAYVNHVVDNPTVGRIHACILTKGDSYYLVDNNSKNGTRLERTRIDSNQEIELTDGCTIEMGTEKFYFYRK